MSFDPTHRRDLLLEFVADLDESGDYTSDWLETADIYTVRIVAVFNGGTPVFHLEEAQYDTAHGGEPRVLRTQNVPVSGSNAFAELDISARYLRLTVQSGITDGGLVAATVRAV